MLGKMLFITSRFGGLPQGIINSLKRMNADYVQVPIWNMEESYETFKPQVVIFFHHFLKEWDEETVERINRLACHKILWSWEEPWEIDYLYKFSPYFSFVFTQDKESWRYLENRGVRAKFIPHAADPESCSHIQVPFEYRSDLCFIGAAYPSRLAFFREVLPALCDYKVIIGGTGWEFLPDTFGQKIINTGVGAEEYIKYVNGARINVNLHRKWNEVPIANSNNVTASSPNNRFFEISMMGKFQMIDESRIDEARTYTPGMMLCSFDSPSLFVERFKTYIANTEFLETQGKEAQECMKKYHTYENRFIELISPLI